MKERRHVTGVVGGRRGEKSINTSRCGTVERGSEQRAVHETASDQQTAAVQSFLRR